MADKINTEEFIRRAREVHGEKYDYSKTIYKRSTEKVIITCPIHGDFEQLPYVHVYYKCGCKRCSTEKLRDLHAFTNEEFIQMARDSLGDKYDYSLVNYKNAHEKVTLVCPIHGEFERYGMEILYRKAGCQLCTREEKGIRHRVQPEEYMKRVKEKFGDTYIYDKTNYTKMTEAITVTCRTHGDFTILPQDFIEGNGCPKCSRPYYRGRTKEELLADFRKKHGYKYQYEGLEDYAPNSTYVCIVCPKHGPFKQRIANHLRGDGCPRCRNSKQELIVEGWLTENNISFEREKRFPWLKHKNHLRIDFYLPDFNVAIEVQGQQHFNADYVSKHKINVEYIKKLDSIKAIQCRENGLRLIHFCYYPGWITEDYPFRVITRKKDLMNAIRGHPIAE